MYRWAGLFVMLASVTTGALAAPLKLDPSLHPGAPKAYDESVDATRALDDAVAAARQSHKELLIDFGANWCPDCRALAGVLALDPVAHWVGERYAVILIDVGRFNKNLDLAERYGTKITAVPTVLVVKPDGSVANRDEIYALSDARTMSAQAVVDKLDAWAEKRAAP